MKWKKVIAFAMSAALLVSAPFTNANLIYADEATEQGQSVEGAEPENEESTEGWSGTVDPDMVNPAEKIREEKEWKPADSVQDQSTGIETGDDMAPKANGAEVSEPEDEEEKSGKVTLEETENDAAASELIRDVEKKDSIREFLNEQTVSETDEVPVIIVLEEESIIENDSDAELDSATRARSRSLETKQESVISEIEDTVLDGEELDISYQYTWLLNGVATEVPYGAIEDIEEIDGVKEVILQTVYNVAENTVTPYTVADGEMIGRDETWRGGYTGKGAVISIIDTGIDDDHQNFEALPDSLLTEDSATRETVSAALNDLNAKKLRPEITVDNVYRSTKIAYGFNYVDGNLRINHTGDTAGDHGTHVAGIAAANDLKNGEAVGVAPDAQLYVMKVFGANGGAYTEDILAALEDSLILGADVVNMSLGSPAGFTSDADFIDEIYGRVSDTNTILAVAAGNSASAGQGNMWGTDTNLTSNPDNSTVSSPATYVNATSVASVDNAAVKSYYIEANGKKIGYSEGANGANAPMVATLGGNEYEYAIVPNLGQSLSDFTDVNVEGKIAVVSRGINAFTQKIAFAEEAGAVACLVYNNTTGTINMDMTDGTSTIPCASITMQAGQFLEAALEENSGCKMAFSAEQGLVENETAYRMSSFSSWGISPNLSLEPDITAPGGNIYSTLDGGSYGLMSGTSMATPNVAGLSALVMQYAKENYPNKSASELHEFVNSLLVSTAEPLPYDETTMFSPRSQGAGLANAFNAVTTKAYLSVDGMDVPKVELKDDPAKTGTYTYNFKVHNFGDKDAYYKLSTNAQTEDVLEVEELGKNFMAMAPIALDAVTTESSNNLIYTYDYNENGKTNSSDARSLYLKVKYDETANADEFFRYDLNSSEDSNYDDVQEYLDALVGKSDVDLKDQVLKVKKGNDASVSVKIQVTDAGKSYMDSNFENGIYVEGFTVLEAKNNGGVDLSIPYMGFYGDWTKAPIIDSGFYWQSDDEIEASQYLNIIFTNFGDNYWYPGLNPYYEEEFDKNNISVSPNGDGYGDYFEEIYLSLLRNAGELRFTYTDAETGKVYYDEVINNVPKSYYNDNYGQIIPFVCSEYHEYYFTDEKGRTLPNDTKLIFSISAKLDYNAHEQKNESAVWKIPVTVDTEAPILEESEVYVGTDGKRHLSLTFKDNVAVTALNFLNKGNTMIVGRYPVDKTAAGESCTMDVDITGFGNQFNLVLEDYAFNERTYVIRTEDNDPVMDENLLYGYRVADANYADDSLYGWIGIDKETAKAGVFDSEYYMDYALTAAEYIGGYIVAADSNHTLLFIKPGYWDERTQIAKLDVNILEMAFDPSEETLYAYSNTNKKLCTIDIASGEVTPIGSTDMTTVRGMCFDDDGTLYGVDQSGSLRTIDKENGVWGAELLKTGITPNYAQSMTYDSKEDVIYWAAFNRGVTGNTGMLYCYSPKDNKLEPIGTIAGNAEVVGLLMLDDRGYQLPEAELSAIGLEQSSISILEGDVEELNLILTPWYGTEQQLYWSSENPEIADVSQNGEVMAISAGQTKVTVSNEDKTLQASCDVYVINPQSDLNAFVMTSASLQNQWISFSADDLRNVDVQTEADFRSFYAGEYLDGYIYAYSSSSELYRINADTLEAEKISDATSEWFMQDMAYDYSSGYMYGIMQDMYGSTWLVTIDTLTGEWDYVGYMDILDDYEAGACALAISTEGTIYVITYAGMLYTYDAEEGELSLVGYTGYAASQYTQCMAYDHNTDELYWAMLSSNGAAGLMYVDTRTGRAIALGTIDGGAQMTAMYSVPDEIPERGDVPVEELRPTDAIVGGTMRMLTGSTQAVPIQVLPTNATDRTVDWKVADETIATINGSMITAKKAGSTTVSGTKEITVDGETEELPISFVLKVFESAGDLYGYIQTDLEYGYGQFWGTFPDNDLSTGEGIADTDYDLNAGTWYDGKIYGYGVDADTYDYQYMVIDDDTYEITKKVVSEDFPDMLDLAFDYTEGAMYAVGGIRNVENNTTLYTIDIETGKPYKIADLEARFWTLACDKDGVLYGVATEGWICTIDKKTGELDIVVEQDRYTANAYQSMAFDYDTGNLYWAQLGSKGGGFGLPTYDSNLLLVDLEDAVIVNLGKIGLSGAVVPGLYTVPKNDIPVGTPKIEKILMGSKSEMLKVGETVQLSAVTYPVSVNTAATEFTYQSSDQSVATVDGNGLVTAVAVGTADITVSAGAMTETCTVNVVGDDKMIHVVNTSGWEVSPLLSPGTISEKVELPDSAKLEIATATYCNDGYFYAVGTDGYLWRYTEDLETVEKIGSDMLIKQFDNFDEKNAYAPHIVDIEATPSRDKVYVMASGVEYGSIAGYICEVDLSNGELVGEMIEVWNYYVQNPVEFVFTGENEVLVYDYYNDYIYSMPLDDPYEIAPAVWAQSVIGANDIHIGMAYSQELDRVFIASTNDLTGEDMGLYIFDQNTGRIYKYANAKYSDTMVDLILIEGSEPAGTALEEEQSELETKAVMSKGEKIEPKTEETEPVEEQPETETEDAEPVEEQQETETEEEQSEAETKEEQSETEVFEEMVSDLPESVKENQ